MMIPRTAIEEQSVYVVDSDSRLRKRGVVVGFVLGKQAAIVGGLVRGARGALRELVEAYATELGHWPIVIATGGDAELVCGKASESELVQAVVPELSLRGVAMAYYRSLLK